VPVAPHAWARFPGLRFGHTVGNRGQGRIQLAVRRAFTASPTTCGRPLRSLSTRWSAFGVTVGATAIAGPWSALYVKLPTVLAPLIRRVNRGSGGLKTPATDKSFAPSD